MSRSICLRCLSRPLAPIEQQSARQLRTNIDHVATFSSTPSLAVNPPKKKAIVQTTKRTTGAGTAYRQGRQTGKKVRAPTGRPPAAGERKALRKRIILSNTNALEVTGLRDLSDSLVTKHDHTQVLGLSNEVVDSLRAIEAFKPTQGWSMFRRPATLVRQETIDLADDVEDVIEAGSTVRRVIHGERGSGKSVLTLQAMSMAFLKGWIVFHIPEGRFALIDHIRIC
jgi:small subunit ribosomal protein S29